MANPTLIKMRNVTLEIQSLQGATPQVWDWTSQADSASLEINASEQERSTFGNDWKYFSTGMKGGTLSIDLYNNYDADGINECLDTIFFDEDNRARVTVIDGDSDKGYTAEFVLTSYSPLDGGTDDDSHTTVSLTLSGLVERI